VKRGCLFLCLSKNNARWFSVFGQHLISVQLQAVTKLLPAFLHSFPVQNRLQPVFQIGNHRRYPRVICGQLHQTAFSQKSGIFPVTGKYTAQ